MLSSIDRSGHCRVLAPSIAGKLPARREASFRSPLFHLRRMQATVTQRDGNFGMAGKIRYFCSDDPGQEIRSDTDTVDTQYVDHAKQVTD